MSITLAPRDAPSIEEIDAELDRFNDALNDLGYEATVRTAAWGEQVIEVTADSITEPIEEFWERTPGFLDDFRAYANNTIDNTSVPRSAMMKEMGL